MNGPIFRTITDQDWQRELRAARAEKNNVSEQIRAALCLYKKAQSKIMSRLKAKAPELIKPRKSKVAIFGPSGVGKTTFALKFPVPYYYDVEGGATGDQYREALIKSGGGYMGPDDGTLLPETLIEQMQALATERHNYKTLIIDSKTKLYQTAIANESERLGSKDAFGASKKPAVAFMRRFVMWLSRLDMNVVIVCHESAEWGVDANGQRTEIGKAPDIWDKLVYELDLVIQAKKQGPERVAFVKKTRLSGFPDGTIFPLEYADFAARHGREAIEGESVRVVLATPAQIDEIKKLASIVAGSAELQAKWFDKADVDSFEEMTGEQIAKCCDVLKKKLSGATETAAA